MSRAISSPVIFRQINKSVRYRYRYHVIPGLDEPREPRVNAENKESAARNRSKKM